MDEQHYKKLVKDINQAIKDARINDALASIKEVLIHTANNVLNNEYDSIQTDYQLMLSFMQNGGKDPQRQQIHKRIVQRVYQLLDQLQRTIETDKFDNVLKCISTQNTPPEDRNIKLLQDAINRHHADLTKLHLQENNPTQKKLIQEKELELYQCYISAFNSIWLQGFCNSEQANNLKEFIENTIEEKHQAFLISALFLNTWCFFDVQKFLALIHFAQSEKNLVRVRAITSIVLLYIKYQHRLEYFEIIQQAIKALENNKQIVHELAILQKQLYLSLEAKTIEKRMREKIFPEIMKGKMYQRSKMGFEDIEIELEETIKKESKRNWNNKENNALAHEMQEIMKMQQQGVDVNLGTFSALKLFPFFQQQLSSWFIPFNIDTPEIYTLYHNEEGNIITNLLPIIESPHYCDSDKYSLSIMIQNMPTMQRDFILNEILTKLNEEHDEDNSILLIKKENSKIEVQYRLYLQNLYRFFHLNNNGKKFPNPFELDLCLTHYSDFDNLLNFIEYKEQMVDFLMQFNHYEEAIEYLEYTIKQDEITPERLQKLGLCYQEMNNITQAIAYYQKADILNPDNEWTLTHLQMCYSSLGNYQEALDCLLKLEQITPENTKIVSETGFCLLQLKRYEEAANRFYKLEYKGERVWPSTRAIAWCNFKMSKFEQATKYYTKIIDNGKAKWEDYLNIGHTLWCKGDIKQAIDSYKIYKELYSKNIKENQNILAPFLEDYKELHAHGIPQKEIALMHDIIQNI